MTNHRAEVRKRHGSRHGFTLIELLVVIAIISIIAGFLVPTLLRGRGEAYKVQCVNNLKQLHAFASEFANKKGTNSFPVASGADNAAHDSLQLLVDYAKGDLNPKLFNCPEGETGVAELDDDENYVLDAGTLSYAWAAKRVKLTTNKPLGCDKYFEGYEDEEGELHSGHKDGINVMRTDGSISFVLQDDLDEEDDYLPRGLTR